MSTIEIYSPQETQQVIEVRGNTPQIIDYAEEAKRYEEEAKRPGLNKMEIWSKLDTAKALSEIAISKSKLDDRVQEYLGNKPPTSR